MLSFSCKFCSNQRFSLTTSRVGFSRRICTSDFGPWISNSVVSVRVCGAGQFVRNNFTHVNVCRLRPRPAIICCAAAAPLRRPRVRLHSLPLTFNRRNICYMFKAIQLLTLKSAHNLCNRVFLPVGPGSSQGNQAVKIRVIGCKQDLSIIFWRI